MFSMKETSRRLAVVRVEQSGIAGISKIGKKPTTCTSTHNFPYIEPWQRA
jgi:hypothetical protein